MNRKNLTAAVLAGLTGVAALAGAAQADSIAVNLNPDGLGEVLLYPYYTTKDGNQTLVTVVNTTGDAKAVKVRFLEGRNSQEVLDFNLYLSPYDVWVASVADSSAFGAAAGVPHMYTNDTSCTVPYIYEMGSTAPGLQAFLPYALDSEGGTDIERTAEGYIEVIEMGVMTGNDSRPATTSYPGRMSSKEAATHVYAEDEDGNEIVPAEPADCSLLVRNWTLYEGWTASGACTVGSGCKAAQKTDNMDGWWAENSLVNCSDPDDWPADECAQADNDHPYWPGKTSTSKLGGGLFGGAAILNVANGTMVSYNARAVQGFDYTPDGLHFYPGTIYPALASGNVTDAWVSMGGGMTALVDYPVGRGIDAVSAVFMHDTVANTFVVEEDIAAATEWVMTFPTKRWYVDEAINETAYGYYRPDPADAVGCNGWKLGDPNPYQAAPNGEYGEWGESCTVPNPNGSGDWWPGSSSVPDPECDDPNYLELEWGLCDVVKNTDTDTVAPFTSLWDGEACEEASLRLWDREESVFETEFGFIPPVVSPAPPAPPGETEAPFELCYEVNVLRFGEGSVFGGELIDDSDYGLTYSVSDIAPAAGWGRITLGNASDCVACDKDDEELHRDERGLIGLPVTGFAAETYTNGNVADGVLANYGGLFDHKGSVACDYDTSKDCGSGSVPSF